MKISRMLEFIENAVSYLKDNDLLDDFLEDRYLELTEEEKSYFGIDAEESEEE